MIGVWLPLLIKEVPYSSYRTMPKWNIPYYIMIGQGAPFFDAPEPKLKHLTGKKFATLAINRVFAKSGLRLGLQVRSKTETKPNLGFKRVCEEQSVNFSFFQKKEPSVRDSDFSSIPRKTTNLKANSSTASLQLPRSGGEQGFTCSAADR